VTRSDNGALMVSGTDAPTVGRTALKTGVELLSWPPSGPT
jgi:hypothetical protein